MSDELPGASPVDRRVRPLAWQDVVRAIYSVQEEASKRGEMYPQTADEQRADRSAVARVVEMLMWYEKNTGCARLKGWPAVAAQKCEWPECGGGLRPV